MSDNPEDGILETLNETAEHMIEQDDAEGYGWLANNVYAAMRVIRQIQRERDEARKVAYLFSLHAPADQWESDVARWPWLESEGGDE